MSLVITPSKLKLLATARPLEEIGANRKIRRLIVDRQIDTHFAAARLNFPLGMLLRGIRCELADNGFLAIIALDEDCQFVGCYRGSDWPHTHPCPLCGSLHPCECAFPEMDFDDVVARCPNCRAK